MIRTLRIPLLAFVSLATPATSQKSQPSIFPLEADAVWTYRYTIKTNLKNPVMTAQLTCIRQVKVKDGKCWECRWRQHKYRSYRYWAVRKDGLLRYHNAMLGGLRGVNRRQKPNLMLALPAGITPKWKWTQEGSVQTSGGSRGPDPAELRMHYSGAIEAMQDEIKVPAGTYKCVRVLVEWKSRYLGKSREHFWYAPGVGLIKRVAYGKTPADNHVYELTKYEPGFAIKEEPATTAKKLLAGDPFKLGKPDSVQLIEQRGLNDCFRSRFFVARWAKGKETRFVRVLRGKASTFDATNPKHWDALFVAEKVRPVGGPADPGDGQQVAEDTTKAYGVLTAYLRHPDLKGKIFSRAPRTSYSFKTAVRVVNGTCVLNANGKSTTYRQKVEFTKGKITGLWTNAQTSSKQTSK